MLGLLSKNKTFNKIYRTTPNGYVLETIDKDLKKINTRATPLSKIIRVRGFTGPS